MPPKRSIQDKQQQEEDSEPEEEMSRPLTETEGETKEMVEEEMPAVVDWPSGKEMTKDELWDEWFVLQEELQGLRKEKKHLKFEIALKSSGNTKRYLESTKVKLRERLQLKQEGEKSHQAEIEEYQKKLAQLESAHHSKACELKMDAVAKTSKTHLEDVTTEVEMQRKTDVLQSEMREKKAITEICWKLRQKHQDELRELRRNAEEQLREMEARCMHDIKIMYKRYKKKSKTDLEEMDENMKKITTSVVKEREAYLRHVACCLFDLKRREMEKIVLGRSLEHLKKMDWRADKAIVAAKEENKALRKAFWELKQKNLEREQELVVQRAAMAKRIKKSNKLTERILKESRDLYVKNQPLQLKYEQAQQKYEELQRMEAVLSVQQKSGLKVMVLEKQIKTVTETLEKQQLKLWVALAFGLGDQTTGKNIKEVFKSKHTTIKALRDETFEDLMEYDQLLKAATAVDPSVDQGLSTWHRCMEKSIRKDSEDIKKLDDFMQELEDLCTPEDNCTHR